MASLPTQACLVLVIQYWFHAKTFYHQRNPCTCKDDIYIETFPWPLLYKLRSVQNIWKRPWLACEEPGLRPIGQSPSIPDKSSWGLGSMSQCSAQILICFLAYIFNFFFISLWVWVGTLQDCHHARCPLPLFSVIKMRLAIRQSNLPVCFAAVQAGWKHSWHLCHSTGEIDR